MKKWKKKKDMYWQEKKGREKNFRGGHPSKYWLDSMLLNFSDRTRSLCWLGYPGAERSLQKTSVYKYM